MCCQLSTGLTARLSGAVISVCVIILLKLKTVLTGIYLKRIQCEAI